MRRGIIHLRILMMCALILGLSGAAALAQQAEVVITSPAPNSEVSGVVSITGSASTSNFAFFKVEFGAGPNPNAWTLVGNTHETPVVNGQLETWDTTRLADGEYTLRLQAVKTDGNYDEYYIHGIVVASDKPTATPTAPTPTRRPSATPADNVTPQATATLQVIRPTAGAQLATPTPTPVRVTSSNTLQLDTAGWKQAFVVGVIAMAIVFAILGVIFGLRRLL